MTKRVKPPDSGWLTRAHFDRWSDERQARYLIRLLDAGRWSHYWNLAKPLQPSAGEISWI